MRRTMSLSPALIGVLAGVLALVSPVIGQANPQCPAGPNIAGIVIGSILATLAVVGIIIAILLFIRWKKRPKKAKAATKTGDAGLEQAHVNPAFQDDSGTTGQQPAKANDVNFAEQGFAGYVPCKEFEHAVRKEPTRSNGSLGRSTSPFVAKLPMHNFGTKLTKSGSHGSLDDSYPSLAMHSSAIELSKIRSLDPEVINVPLQSQDIIGLGFNICGNLRDGIFVSQVLNRGPASESRLIKPGDRILGITISFENMVYEDALTILSYASPYPVKLQVQKKSLKASDPDVTGDDYEEALHLHHPKYRSQSMDDVSKIAQESVSRMRRAWSEMKRGSSKRKQEEEEVIVEENRLRRWSGKPNHGEPVGDAGSDEKSDNSTVSIPDLQLDSTDLVASYDSGSNKGAESTQVTVHQAADFVVVDLVKDEVNLEEITLNQTEAPTLGLSPKRQAEADRKEGLRLSYEVDRPIRKLDLEEAPDLELKKGGFGIGADDMEEVDLELPDHGFSMNRPDSPDLGLAVKRPESPDLEFSLPRRDSLNSQSSSRNSPSPVILTGNMGLDLKIGAAFDDTPDAPIVLVPDVGQEVAIDSEPASSPVMITDHDGFLDIDLKNTTISSAPGHTTDSPSPPPSPPPGPPPLLSEDSAADVTESSMLVLVNEESILKRDGGSGNEEEPVVLDHAAGDHEDESVHDMLKDYFSDQPSLMERLGLSKPAKLEGSTEEVVLPKRLSSDAKVTGHEPLLDEHIENSRVLQKAKDAIRRRSSSSEEEPHISSPSTLSSRSSSPTEPHEQHTIEQGDETTPPKERKRKSHSPLVKKRSTGGLAYDISSSEYHEMAVDVPEKDINNPPGGVAYFVSIDEHFHGAPLTLRPDDDEGLEDEQVDQPSLVKAWGLPNMSGHYSHDQYDTDTTKQVNEVVTLDTRDDGPTSIITETRTTTVTLSNNNNESGMNGKGGDSPIGSPLKSTKELVTTTEVSKSNEVITVTRHEEIQGAYTVTVNASSHNDDSEA